MKANIFVNLLLTLLTCGLYGIIWFIMLTDDAAYKSKNSSISGGLALIFTILTCGIYSIFWNYNMGKMIYEAKKEAGIHANDNSILYLVLGLFGFTLVNYCIMQSELNEIE